MAFLSIELRGPDFIRNASTLLHGLKFNGVNELRVILGHESPASPNVKAAIRMLKPYLHSGATVLLVTKSVAEPLPSTSPEQSAPGASRPFSQQQALYLIVEPLRLREKIQKTIDDITVTRTKTGDKGFQNLDAYIRG